MQPKKFEKAEKFKVFLGSKLPKNHEHYKSPHNNNDLYVEIFLYEKKEDMLKDTEYEKKILGMFMSFMGDNIFCEKCEKEMEKFCYFAKNKDKNRKAVIFVNIEESDPGVIIHEFFHLFLYYYKEKFSEKKDIFQMMFENQEIHAHWFQFLFDQYEEKLFDSKIYKKTKLKYEKQN